MTNVILATDSYKASHFKQYPEGTTYLKAYFEARTDNEDIKFFGLQYIIDQYVNQTITAEMVEEAKEVVEAHGLPFPYEGWMKVVNEYDGKIPLKIRAVTEGTVVPSSNALFTVESLDEELFWLVTWFETCLARVWFPTTVATRSMRIKRVIADALERSGDPEGLPFKLHDFGARGTSSGESAAIGGVAHLTNFMGTDTMEALVLARKHYYEDMAGFSIPASEHSTITSWGRDREVDAFKNMLDQFATPGSLVACVSDSYDIYNAVSHLWGDDLKQQVIDSGAILVVRPDSGEPLDMVLYCLRTLGEKFGYTVNDKGYKVLNHVRVIQGDGVSEDAIKTIVDAILDEGWSMDNLAFGMGGEMLQKMDRDTHKFAYKVCLATINGEQVPIYKDPVGSFKTSKRGDLDLVFENTDHHPSYITVDRLNNGANLEPSAMSTVYELEPKVRYTLDQIRKAG